jgi:hypothetical protein
MIADFLLSDTLAFRSGPKNLVINTRGKLFMLTV